MGDELGFPESLGNVEGSRKRSLDVHTGGRNAVGFVAEKPQPAKTNVSMVKVAISKDINLNHMNYFAV